MSSWNHNREEKVDGLNRSMSTNYYELLDVEPAATENEIEEAYTQAISLYQGDSVASYSLYTNSEREELLTKLQEAYNILRNPSSRQAYNKELQAKSADIRQDDAFGNIRYLHVEQEQHDPKSSDKLITFRHALAVMDDKDPMTTEQFRILSTRITEISRKESLKIFAVTSALKGEGKTSTCINLAYLMAHEFKHRVLLVEGDLRNPSVKSYFNDDGTTPGLIDVIRGKAEFDRAIHRLKGSELYILRAGNSIKNSSELLSSGRMSKLVRHFKEQFDFVLFDSPPVLAIADMNIISRLVDGLILVVRAGKTPKDSVLKATQSLSGGNIIGIVLNGTEAPSDNYGYYY